jgi:putative ABC transport system substrate-binding protein
MMLSEEEAQKGALASYGVDYFDLGKQTARLAVQVLAGRKPSEIPSEPPRKFHFVINLKSASQLGIEIPESVLIKANKIIK